MIYVSEHIFVGLEWLSLRNLPAVFPAAERSRLRDPFSPTKGKAIYCVHSVIAATAAQSTMSSTEQPRETSLNGRRKP
jgi:hypothetical protein